MGGQSAVKLGSDTALALAHTPLRISLRDRHKLGLVVLLCVVCLLGVTPLRMRALYLVQEGHTLAIRAGLVDYPALGLTDVRPAMQDDFAGSDITGWSLQKRTVKQALGPMLGPFTKTDPVLVYAPALPAQADHAVITFDLHLFGSWDARHPRWGGADGDAMIFGINDQPLWQELFQNWGQQRSHRRNLATIGGARYGLTLVRTALRQDYRGWNKSFDESWHIRLEAEGDLTDMRLSLRSTANDPTDEWFGITNLAVLHN